MTDTASWDLLVVGGTILTMEEDAAPIENGAIALSDGRIVAVGPAEELLELAPTGEVVDASDCIVMPGFVNTHAHLPMTLLRGLADDLPLKDWLEQHIWPAEKAHMNRESIRIGTRLAAAELLLNGVTTTADMYFFDDEIGDVLAAIGMRGVVAESVIDFPTPRCATVDDMMVKQRELVDRFKNHPLIQPAIAPHAPYTVCAANLVREADLAEELGVPLHIHLSETRWEVEKLLEEKGKSPVAYLAELGVLTERTVAAHCVHVSPEDIEILAEFEVGVSHNPVSNLKLGSGVAPVPAMLEAGVKLAFGTDGPASNNTLDLLRDAQIAALLHKGVRGEPTVLPAGTVLNLLTVGGARVLGLDDRIGTLSEGKEADLICIATEGPAAVPLYEPESFLVYAARSSKIRHVLVRGRVLVRNGALTTIDLEETTAKARELARSIRH